MGDHSSANPLRQFVGFMISGGWRWRRFEDIYIYIGTPFLQRLCATAYSGRSAIVGSLGYRLDHEAEP